MNRNHYDFAVVGGGIVGLATAWTLVRDGATSLVLLEKEARLAAHQTGHNSGVIHSGLYYRPGSLKARNCTSGREQLYAFCREQGVPHEACGKLVVATREEELPRLDELQRRGMENGLVGIQRLAATELHDFEPCVAGVGGLHVPQTGIVDFVRVAETLAALIRRGGADIRTGWNLRHVKDQGDSWQLRGPAGEVRCRFLINCAGLFSDRVARLCGLAPEVRILPFRGEYYRLRPQAARRVRHLIYPVPDPAMPFLGVHLTRMSDGRVEAGPNAVLALKREGYRRTSFSLGDVCEMLAYPGFWRMARRFWRVGANEYRRSLSRRLFLADLQRLVPTLCLEDLAEPGAGVRAQAVGVTGELIDDFRIVSVPRMVHVLNAPSPAATASLAIGAAIVERVRAVDA